MKKLLSFTLMACGLFLMTHQVNAANFARTPKEVFVSSYTTGAILVTPAVSTNAASGSGYMPGAVYQVNLATGASSEFELLIDTTNCTGVTAAMATGNLPAQGYQQIGPRFMYGSTTAGTVYTIDPPIRFDQGLCIIDSASTGSASITYELGRGLSGQ